MGKSTLKHDLDKAEDTYDMVEVFYEHKDDSEDAIRECVTEISVVDYNLNKTNIELFLSIISKCKELKLLTLQNCGEADHVALFLLEIAKTECKIASIHIWGVKPLGTYLSALWILLRKARTKSLKLQATNFGKIASIHIWGVKLLGTYLLALWILLRKARTKSLKLQATNFGKKENESMKKGEVTRELEVPPEKYDQSLNKFEENYMSSESWASETRYNEDIEKRCNENKETESMKKGEVTRELEESTFALEMIDLSYNREMVQQSFVTLGCFFLFPRIRELRMFDCNLTDEKLKNLNHILEQLKRQLTLFDVSGNSKITVKGFKILGQMARNTGFKHLVIRCCNVTHKKLSAFHKSCGRDTKITTFDASYNNTLGYKGMAELGTVSIDLEIKCLEFAGCSLEEKHMKYFMKSSDITGKSLVEELNISDNTAIGNGIVEVSKLINRGVLKRVNMSYCELTRENIRKFKHSLNKDAEIDTLNLSESDIVIKSDYTATVCDLLENISKALFFKFSPIKPRVREVMMQKLEELPYEKKPIIVLQNDEILQHTS